MLIKVIIACVCTFNFLVAYQALCNMGEKFDGGLHKIKYIMTLIGSLCCIYSANQSAYISLALSIMMLTWLMPRVIYYIKGKHDRA